MCISSFVFLACYVFGTSKKLSESYFELTAYIYRVGNNYVCVLKVFMSVQELCVNYAHDFTCVHPMVICEIERSFGTSKPQQYCTGNFRSDL